MPGENHSREIRTSVSLRKHSITKSECALEPSNSDGEFFSALPLSPPGAPARTIVGTRTRGRMRMSERRWDGTWLGMLVLIAIAAVGRGMSKRDNTADGGMTKVFLK